MINRIVIIKITRSLFPPKNPAQVTVGFFDGMEQQATQVFPAKLFDVDIREGQEIDFRKESPAPFVVFHQQVLEEF